MFRKIASTIALMSLGGLAYAQSSVQIYGILDTAVETMNNVGAGRSTLTRMPNLSGSVPSRLGFRGREDLGGGLSASFTLEMGIAPDSG
ncbi:MAG: porin, partial [Comamonas sp.]|uniref:porin n=1 Tax=Comamonas sp. TaxID=34028 RepID=UPI002822DBE7|nr:porin [Comamonas sp.]